MRGLRAAVLPLMLVWSLGTYAQASSLSEEVGRCRNIDNDIARLQCFDTAASSYFAQVAEAKAAAKQWRVGSKVDPISDRVTTILALDEVEERDSYYGYDGRRTLFLRCTHRTLEIAVLWGVPVDESSLRVTIRIGEGEAETSTWISSSNPRMTFYPKDENEFLFKLLQSDKLVVRLHRDISMGGDLTSVFDISGLDAASRQMVSACPPREPIFQ